MKALVKYEKGRHKVRLMECEAPHAGAGQVRIKVAYAGICGTDLHIYEEDGGYKNDPPVILGHELSGIVDEVGPGCKEELLGKAVVSETYFITCGKCFFCKTGRKNLCAQRKSIGSGVNGAMAEYIVVPADNIHLIPEGIGLKEAAMTEPMACCAQAVLEKGNVIAGSRVLITGPGAIGLMCMQFAVQCGGRVLVAGTEKDAKRLELAKSLGAEAVAYSDRPDSMKTLMSMLGENGADIVFECSGAGAAINMGLELVRKGGRFVQVGLTGKSTTLDMNLITLKELELFGTFAQKPVWWTRCLELVEQGKVTAAPLIEEPMPLERWKEAFEGFASGTGMKYMLDLSL